MHLAGVNRNLGSIVQERLFGVVKTAEAITVPVVGKLMVIPGGDPSVVLSQKLKILVGSILAMARAIVVQRKDLIRRIRSTFTLGLILVDVVTKVNHKVMLVLAGGVTVGVKVAIGEVAAGEDGKAEARDGIVSARSRLGAAERALVAA
jgi:hypothetical protein